MCIMYRYFYNMDCITILFVGEKEKKEATLYY